MTTSDQAPQPMAIESCFADVNGIRLHYLAAGAGDPVILLHGYAQTSHMWRPLIAQLAKTRRHQELGALANGRGAGAGHSPTPLLS